MKNRKLTLEQQKQIALAKKGGFDISDFELKKPSLLHGKAASVMLRKKFKVDDAQILEAVAYHVSGKSGMCNLTKALYIADKIEVGRPWVTPEYLEKLFAMSLDRMYYTVLKNGIDYLKNNKKDFMPLPEVKELLEEYEDAK